MQSEALIQVGRILRSHGLSGELKIEVFNDGLEELESGTPCVLKSRFGKQAEMHIERIRFGNDTILKLREMQDKSSADVWSQGEIWLLEKLLPALPEDAFYVKDITGLEVRDESGKKIGILADVETSPAHDLYVIEVQGKRYRIPAVAEFIKAINKETGVITIHLIPGLLEYQTVS